MEFAVSWGPGRGRFWGLGHTGDDVYCPWCPSRGNSGGGEGR